jgi:uncharacterized protein involved in type VI secretion and phage assembly
MRTGELYQRYYGIYLGTVAQVDGDPANLGRVRIETDQFEDDAESNPIWATVIRLGGAETSTFFTPNLGDQVVFGYLAGDVNQPVIFGYSHSGRPEQVPPPDTSPRKHAIVTKTFRIDWNEEEGERKLRMTNRESGDFIEFDAEDRSLTISAETGIIIRAKGIVDIQAAQVQIQDRVVSISNRPL